jgi:transaldolase
LPDSILTVPEPILDAFADHGVPGPAAATRHELESVTSAIDLDGITAELEREGIEAFCDSYRELLTSIERRAEALRGAAVI